MIMGRRFTLDPALLFVGLLFWWFVWGTAGALLAVPMMAAFKIFCERVESLQRLAAFLGDEDAAGAGGGRDPRSALPSRRRTRRPPHSSHGRVAQRELRATTLRRCGHGGNLQMARNPRVSQRGTPPAMRGA